jgi:hypothetical protein
MHFTFVVLSRRLYQQALGLVYSLRLRTTFFEGTESVPIYRRVKVEKNSFRDHGPFLTVFFESPLVFVLLPLRYIFFLEFVVSRSVEG